MWNHSSSQCVLASWYYVCGGSLRVWHLKECCLQFYNYIIIMLTCQSFLLMMTLSSWTFSLRHPGELADRVRVQVAIRKTSRISEIKSRALWLLLLCIAIYIPILPPESTHYTKACCCWPCVDSCELGMPQPYIHSPFYFRDTCAHRGIKMLNA